ncbi:HAD family hydrolase [Arthrobacter jiangjiafuii]|uniref:HAD family hydrolase n=1 Tax=Arthrobacter jiangjiafuii TaxID=2817475 RepID=A0A975M2P8_9MICC|nr:HAD family hydrolase [Arthrobacter jiangjiafuii]MBP3043144.1 HAD family hydrolase [Arthrobacter jiangjiafuii]QWC08699.1 HAD family hydrolase [Arthrobacter jiangjiafuii]
MSFSVPDPLQTYPAPGPLQAVLWDMDGTIVDTEPYWIQAEKDLVHSFGGSWTDADAEAMVGQALTYGAALLQKAGVKLGIRDIIDRMIGQVTEQVRSAVPWRPGARELLAGLAEAGVPCVLVTMSEPVLAREIQNQLPAGTFAFAVTGDMVEHGKPDPEPYQLAFDRLAGQVPGLAKDRVVAIEDSLPGVTSARAAGLLTLGVPHFLPLPADEGRHDWPTLAGRTVADLQALVRGAAGSAVDGPAAEAAAPAPTAGVQPAGARR